MDLLIALFTGLGQVLGPTLGCIAGFAILIAVVAISYFLIHYITDKLFGFG